MKSRGRIARSVAPALTLALAAVLGTALWGCAGAPSAQPRADIVEHTVPHTVVIAPMSGVPVATASRLWTMIADAARQGGFQVVGDMQALAELLELGRRTRDLPREDPAAVRLRSALHAELAHQIGADGVVYVGFAERRARVRDGVAMWDGMKERILAVDEDPHDSASGYRGEVKAWSLRLWIEDADASLVAEGFGGISIETRLHAGRWETAGSGPRLEVPGVLSTALHAAVADLGRAL